MKNGRVSTLNIINLLPVVISKFNYLKFGFFYILGGPVPQFTFLSNLTQMTTIVRYGSSELRKLDIRHALNRLNDIWNLDWFK
jgi:hypothetical protein